MDLKNLPPWVSTWLHGAAFGLLAILTIGLFYATEANRAGSPTGYAVYGDDSTLAGAPLREEKIVVYGCQLSPHVLRLARSQPVTIQFTNYDPTGRPYRLYIENTGRGPLELTSKGREVSSTILVPTHSGNFEFAVYEPCEEFGIEARGRIEVR